jgi:MFS family permease
VRPTAARRAVTVAFFAHGALFGTWVGRIPAIRGDLGLGDGELGLALFGGTVGGVLVLPVAGWLVAREGSRATVVLGLPCFAALLPLLALAPNLPLLALALLGFGAAGGALDVAMNAHGLAVEGRLSGPILSTLHAGWSLGGLAGAGAAGLAAWGDLDPVWHFCAAAGALGGAGLATSRLLLPAAADRPEQAPRLSRPPRVLLPLAVLAFCGLFAEAAAADWSAVYLAGPVGSSPGLAALGFAAFSTAMAVFRLVGDRLTTHLGPVVLTRRGGLVACGGLALALLVQEPAACLAGFALMGAGLAALVPIVFRSAGSIPGLPAGIGLAALTSVGYSAFIVGPPTVGFTSEALGLTAALWIVVALLACMVALAPATRTVRA